METLKDINSKNVRQNDFQNDIQNDLIKPPVVGSIVPGEIVGTARSSVFVDLGPIGTGIIYGKEFYDARDSLKSFKKGDKIFTKIIDLDNDDGYIELSLNRAGKELAWESLRQKKEDGETIEIKILSANKGGLLTEISRIPAFLPSSQLSSEYYPKVQGADPTKILRELQNLIGKKLKVKFLEVSPRDEKIILSEKAVHATQITKALSSFKVNDIIPGEIKGITDFGAFIAFTNKPEIQGFVHISEIAWNRIEKPSDKLKINQKVKAKIIEINKDKVLLSLKALEKDPWKDIEKEFQKGDTVKGKPVKFNPFGAFISIKPGIQGLIHISEFGSSKKMEESLKIGKEYKFKISLLDLEQHKILLTPLEKSRGN